MDLQLWIQSTPGNDAFKKNPSQIFFIKIIESPLTMAHSLWGYVSDLSGPGQSRLGWKRTSPNLKLGNQKLAYQTIFWIYLRPIEENFRYYFSRVGSASSCLIIFRVFRHNFIASSVLAPILLKDSLQYDSYNNCVVLCRITYTPSFITHYVWFIVY